MIASYPAVLGSDVAGTVLAVGSAVTGSDFKPGTRVLAFAPAFYMQGKPDYGGFQKRLIVPSVNATPIPHDLSFKAAAMLPMAVETAFAGFYTIGLPRDTRYRLEDKKGLLLLGASSSVGSAVLQIARMKGFVVYATASGKHHEYLKTLDPTTSSPHLSNGNSDGLELFDYNDEDVVAKIVAAAKHHKVTFQTAYVAVPGAIDQAMEVLCHFKEKATITKVAHAPPIPEKFQQADWAEVKFVAVPADNEEHIEHFRYVFNDFLKRELAERRFTPSPGTKVVEGGLNALQNALEVGKRGVSGVKIVLEV